MKEVRGETYLVILAITLSVVTLSHYQLSRCHVPYATYSSFALQGVGSRVLRAMAREILLAIGDVRAEIVMDMSASFGCGTDEAEQIVSRLVTEEFHDIAISV